MRRGNRRFVGARERREASRAASIFFIFVAVSTRRKRRVKTERTALARGGDDAAGTTRALEARLGANCAVRDGIITAAEVMVAMGAEVLSRSGRCGLNI